MGTNRKSELYDAFINVLTLTNQAEIEVIDYVQGKAKHLFEFKGKWLVWINGPGHPNQHEGRWFEYEGGWHTSYISILYFGDDIKDALQVMLDSDNTNNSDIINKEIDPKNFKQLGISGDDIYEIDQRYIN